MSFYCTGPGAGWRAALLTQHLGEVRVVEVGVLVRQPLALHLGPDHEGVHGSPDPLLLPRPLVPAQHAHPHPVPVVRPRPPHHAPPGRVAGTPVAWMCIGLGQYVTNWGSARLYAVLYVGQHLQ